MASLPTPRLTPEEYLTIDRDAAFKSEYLGGEIFAMAGASRAHNIVANNISTAFNVQLRTKPCDVYTSDMRVQTSPSGLYTFPDVVVVCGTPLFRDDKSDTLLNPTVLVEVLSPSTEAFDRGEKFAQFRRLSSLSDYLLVSQTQQRVEIFTRQADSNWQFSALETPSEEIILASIGCTLTLSDIYNKVPFAAEQ